MAEVDPRIKAVADWLEYNTKVDSYWDTPSHAAEYLLKVLDALEKVPRGET